jgi:predicted ferric reductase
MVLVKKYLAEVVDIENKVEGIYTLQLKSHSGPFKYYPGQFLHLALNEYDPSSGWPESRCFSMQSSPDKENICITYATKGVFTLRMSQELKIGIRVMLKLPYGDLFTQEHLKSNTVFIAGGTGITPFLSLFTNSCFANYRFPCLYFGLRNRSFNLYENELKLAKKINPELEINYMYNDEKGNLNIKEIRDNTAQTSYFFISGPRMMIDIFKTFLISSGITKEQIKTDNWE